MQRDLLRGATYTETSMNVFQTTIEDMPNPTAEECDTIVELIWDELLDKVSTLPKWIRVNQYDYVCLDGLYYRPDVAERMLEGLEIT